METVNINVSIVKCVRSFCSTSKTIPFKLTDIGEGIAEVELMKWFVKEGETINAFDRLCEVQSDKATVEITSRYAGLITKVHHAEGDIVKVGSTLVDIQQKVSTPIQLVSPQNNSTPPTSSSKLQHPSQQIKQHQPVINQNPTTFQDSNPHGTVTTPAVRKLAKENNIDLRLIKGTGPNNRILKEDILNLISSSPTPQKTSPSSPTPHTTPNTPPTVSTSSIPRPKAHSLNSNGIQRVPIRGVKRLMLQSMTKALQVPHLTYGDEIVMDNLITLRELMNSEFTKRFASNGSQKQKSLSYLPLFLKITSVCLQSFPILNATLSEDLTEMLYHSSHNIGVAMASPQGLIVPVIRDVQNKSVFEITQDLNRLMGAAQSNTLNESHFTGGTFTLSNIGSIGGTYMVPVVVVPQVAIGAFGKVQVVPRYTSNPLRYSESPWSRHY